EPFDPAALVEIDRDHALAGDLLVQERHVLLAALRDVIERLAADRGDGRGRAQHDQHLLLAGAERDLLQRALGNDIAALVHLLEGVAAATGEDDAESEHDHAKRARTRRALPGAALQCTRARWLVR